MAKQAIIVSLLVLFLLASDFRLTTSDAGDCYDGCITACPLKDARLLARCERKCSIRCGPGAQAFNFPDRN